jgi:hypothetical protein
VLYQHPVKIKTKTKIKQPSNQPTTQTTKPNQPKKHVLSACPVVIVNKAGEVSLCVELIF